MTFCYMMTLVLNATSVSVALSAEALNPINFAAFTPITLPVFALLISGNLKASYVMPQVR